MKQTATYRVQCKTWRVAQELTKSMGNVLRSSDILNEVHKPPYCLRLVREYRAQIANNFRKQVANEVRKLRNLGEL